jgi:hypothetical protein
MRIQISDVKEKIAKEKGWEASQQKLIYSGMHIAKILDCELMAQHPAYAPFRQDSPRRQHS